jgi:hypothetical protein
MFHLDANTGWLWSCIGSLLESNEWCTVSQIDGKIGFAGLSSLPPREASDTVAVSRGVCLTIPAGTVFQFRNTGREPLVFLCITMPPWRRSVLFAQICGQGLLWTSVVGARRPR